MEVTEIVGKQLTETDYAIRSRASGDDLDGKVSRSSLDLAQLRKDVSGWHERLGRISGVMKAEQRRTEASMQRMLAQLLEEPPPITDVRGVLADAAGFGVAKEVLVGVNAAANVLQSFLEQQEKLLGGGAPECERSNQARPRGARALP